MVKVILFFVVLYGFLTCIVDLARWEREQQNKRIQNCLDHHGVPQFKGLDHVFDYCLPR